jgi:hypothetical protein
MTGSLVVGTLAIAPDQWNDAEGDGSRFVAILIINGVSLHLEALEVRADTDGVQRRAARRCGQPPRTFRSERHRCPRSPRATR